MMDGERDLVASHRFLSLAEKFNDKRYRDGYVASHTRGVLARQMRNFRGNLSQAEFAAQIGKQKTVVSRLENPAYSGWSLRTMLEVARKENVAVLVRFVDFPTFLGFTDDMSDESLHPHAYDQPEIDRFAAYQSGQTTYYDLFPSLDLNRGRSMGPSAYGDIFFGQPIEPSRFNNVTYSTGAGITSGALVTSGTGMILIGGAGASGTRSNLIGQIAGWGGSPVFASSGFAIPPTPGVLARASAEIRRLNNLVTTQGDIIARQKKEIAELEARCGDPQQAQPLHAITRPQDQVVRLQSAA
jgi:hypothetical protein